jgi:hypothetical protein
MADILPLVFQYLSGDHPSLYSCTLVDRSANRAASAVLYHHILFSPPWTATLDLNEAQKYSVRFYHRILVREKGIHYGSSSEREPYCTPPSSLIMPFM